MPSYRKYRSEWVTIRHWWKRNLEYFQKKPPRLQLGSKRELKVSFPQFPREICAFKKNVRSQKIFCVKFSTKMLLMKISVAIILTKLQPCESRVVLWREPTLCRRCRLQTIRRQVCSFEKILHDSRVKINPLWIRRQFRPYGPVESASSWRLPNLRHIVCFLYISSTFRSL